jgi:hypothetical protein
MSALYKAMSKAFAAIEGASKDSKNPHFKSNYADLSSVVQAIKPHLSANGLWFMQMNHDCDGGVCIETIVCHEGGETLSFGKLFIPATKQDAQGFGSALTYARRYGLMTAFGVCPEDDDGNAASSAAPKVKQLAGPYKSKTALWSAIREFDHELHGCGDLNELEGLLYMPETKELIKQVKRDASSLWDGIGGTLPPEFVPLESTIAKMTKDFENIDQFNQKEV